MFEATRVRRMQRPKPSPLEVVLSLAAALLLAACQTTEAIKSPVADAARSWQYGHHSLPRGVLKQGQFSSLEEIRNDPESWPARVAESKLQPGVRLPAVLYLHGCAGFRAGERWAHTVRESGYAFFAPDSFQRPGRENLCGTGRRAMIDKRIPMRRQELDYALEQLKKAQWIDQRRIVLMGFSEGAQTASAYRGNAFAAVVLIGTDCRFSGGSPATPKSVPVLNLVGSGDEWGYGAGCNIPDNVSGSKKVVLDKRRHDLSGDAEARRALGRFLKQCCGGAG